MCREFPYTPCTSHTHRLPHYLHTYLNDKFVLINEPTLTYCHLPRSIVYIRVYSWHTFFGFGYIYNGIYPPLWYCSFSTLKILCVLLICPFPSVLGNHWSLYCVRSFAFFRLSVEIIQCVALPVALVIHV